MRPVTFVKGYMKALCMDDFGVSKSLVSLLVYEKSRFEETLILGQISHCFFAFVY